MWVLKGSIYGALKTLNDLNNQWKAFSKYLYFSKEAFANKISLIWRINFLSVNVTFVQLPMSKCIFWRMGPA